MMRHKENSMLACSPTSTSIPKDRWFVDSDASNHMMSHQEWLRDLQELDRPSYVETADDTTHPIRHVGNVPFVKEGHNKEFGLGRPNC